MDLQTVVCCILNVRLSLAAPKVCLVREVPGGHSPIVRYADFDTLARLLRRAVIRPANLMSDGKLDDRDSYGIHGLAKGSLHGEVVQGVKYVLDLEAFFLGANPNDRAALLKALPPEIKAYFPEKETHHPLANAQSIYDGVRAPRPRPVASVD